MTGEQKGSAGKNLQKKKTPLRNHRLGETKNSKQNRKKTIEGIIARGEAVG